MNQTFCIYCQKEYGTPERLKSHLHRLHKDTYAQYNLAPTQEEKNEQRKAS